MNQSGVQRAHSTHPCPCVQRPPQCQRPDLLRAPTLLFRLLSNWEKPPCLKSFSTTGTKATNKRLNRGGKRKAKASGKNARDPFGQAKNMHNHSHQHMWNAKHIEHGQAPRAIGCCLVVLLCQMLQVAFAASARRTQIRWHHQQCDFCAASHGHQIRYVQPGHRQTQSICN